MIGAVLGVVAVLVLVAATAFFVAVEFSLVAVDRTAVELAAAGGDRRSRMVADSLRRLSFHLSGVQLGITVCSVGIGVLAEPNVARLIRGPIESVVGGSGGEAMSVVVALAVATVVQMVVGELVPKAIAVARPGEVARFLAPAQRVYVGVFRPVILVFGAAADRVVRLLGVEPTEELSQVRSRHELAKLVESSGAEGTLEPAEVELLTRTFRFREKVVAEALTPRTSVVALPLEGTGADLRGASVQTGFSRFPLVGPGGLDDVVGMVHVKALFDLAPHRRDGAPLTDLRVDVMVVPESRPLDSLLLEMRATATTLAVVMDEYGGTAGIITMEDLLEEIVGEIDDEHDPTMRRTTQSWGGTSVVAGRLSLDEVLDDTGLRLPDGDGDYETLAGFVLTKLGRIPAEGDGFMWEGWSFEVLEMEGRRISTVRLTEPLTSAPSTGEAP